MSIIKGDREYFQGIGKIAYEGRDSDNPLSFKWYNPDQEIGGKSMKELFRFAIAYWHTFCGTGGDPFGPEHLAASAGAATGFGYPSNNCKIGLEAGEGVESAATIEALKPLNHELIVQGHTYDKFYGTHLDLALRSLEIDRFMITGVTTDCCVNSTIISGSTRNYRVTAVSDAMATIHDHIHDACLQIWENKFARIRTTAEVLAEINSQCGLDVSPYR